MLYLPSENAPAPPKPFMIAQVGQCTQVLIRSPSIGHLRFSSGLPASNTATRIPGASLVSSYAVKIPPGPAPTTITS